MFFMRKTTALPSATEALPGRATPIPTATRHFVNGRALQPPYPEGLEQAVFGLGCFWGAERKFWELGDGIFTTAVGYAGGYTPNPTYEEVCSGRTGHTEAVLVVFDPKKVPYEKLLKTFWENHNPTQGMRQGNDVVQRHAEESRGRLEGDVPEGTRRKGSQHHHHGDRRRRPVLFCRGLSSAISRQEPGGLLRPRRHRRVLPDRRRRQRGMTFLHLSPR
jgi:Peptide methionine sulfoxide reductase